MEFKKLAKFAEDNKLNIGEKELKQFETFGEYLKEKNKVMNLTGIDEPEEAEIKHYIDSLEGAVTINELKDGHFSLIDIGTGAGFPGIPLKIAFAEEEFVLMDSLNKRINFINEAIEKTGLTDVKAVAARAEDLARGEYREYFDFCTSRAVASANVLLEYSLPFVKTGGYCILYKSGNYKVELEEAKGALEILGGEIYGVREFSLPETEGDRCIVVIKKVKTTPDKYPRKAGKPTKSPLR